MKLSKEKRNALWVIAAAIILHAISLSMLKNTYGYHTSGAYEGPGLLVSTIGLIVWIYGFMRYARAKGQSELLAVLLSLFWLLGLLILLLLQDKKAPTKS